MFPCVFKMESVHFIIGIWLCVRYQLKYLFYMIATIYFVSL